MDNYNLSEYIIECIDNGEICDTLKKILNSDDIYINNEAIKQYKKFLLVYAKAYMVYVISGYVQNYNFGFNYNPNTKRMDGSQMFTNYIQLKSNPEMVYDEISILFDIMKKASLSDNDLRAMYVKDELDFINLYSCCIHPRFASLSKYDAIINVAIERLRKTNHFKLSNESMLRLAKCYIISKEDMDDPEYVCGSSLFMDNIILDSYSIYENCLKSFESRVNSRDDDLEKINELRRIIKMNKFKSR